ncbi:Na+/H+ antiporter subunit G [Marinospirillum sp.]|uniref:Na+/H+ antiporter subunit G n=1 Tax=Marinospirillum sp. TaxID=2183934 RepID=UPI0028704272|nr:Na+/H+ antiporter subunit G [Marinospirillum sp.]MDR9468117.1 Na+/H+ antiporter subunit G [Marinospirillum sp.]
MNWIDLIAAVFILIGGVFILIGSIGLIRLPDFYMRLHAPTKATTLGLGSLLMASMLLFTSNNDYFSIHEILITLFLLITAPVSAHMMAKAALHVKTRTREGSKGLKVRDAAQNRSKPEEG